MKKNKAFTLIELLAVIVILALIALIAVPRVLDTLQSSRKAAFKQSAIGVLDSVDLYVYGSEDDVREFDVLDIHTLDAKNLSQYTGIIKNIDDNYYLSNFSNGEYCISGSKQTIADAEVLDAGECEIIDTTAPEIDSIVTDSTTSSVKVTVYASDDETELSLIKFSLYDGDKLIGNVIEKEATMNPISHEFKELISSHGYKVVVEVINTGVINTSTTKSVNVITKGLATMSATASPSNYAQSKTGTVTFNGDGTYLIKPSVETKINISAIACSSVSDAKFTCDGTIVASNGTLAAGTWYKVTSSPTLTFTSNGTLAYKVSDGTNYIDGGALTITGIDRTAPTLASFTTTTTTNSITIVATGIDDQSGISRYQFSKDDGLTWLPETPQKETKYTFDNLTTGTYDIKVKVINGTYENNGQNSLNTTTSNKESIKTGELATMSATSSPSGYAQNKTGTITFTGSGTYLIKPSVETKIDISATTCSSVSDAKFTCDGTIVASNGTLAAGTWYKVTSSPTLTFTSNGTLAYKVSDGTNYIDGGALTINNIDRTVPSTPVFTTDKTTNSITIKIGTISSDSESGITGYQFSNDNGATWFPSTPQSVTTYTFTGLTSGTYNIKVRAINGTYANNKQNDLNTATTTASAVTTTSLATMSAASSPSGYAQSKTGTVTFTGDGAYLIRPSVDVTTNIASVTCSSVSDAKFTCDGTVVSANGTLVAGTWYKVTSSPNLTFTSNGSVTYKVADGTNYIDGGALTITGIDRTAPSAPIFTTSKTTNSITATVNTVAKDNESGITGYQFSIDGGTTWYPNTPQKDSSYKFSDLTSGIYNVKVRAINGTYANNGQNSLNTSTTNAISTATEDLATMSAASSPSGYAQSKTGTITFTGSGTYLIRPSVDVTTNISATTCSSVSDATFTCEGTTVAVNETLKSGIWYKVASSPTLTFISNGSVNYKAADGTNYIDGGALTITGIDRTAPSTPTFTTSKSTNSITVTIGTVSADEQSGIKGYQFSNDGGATWKPISPQTGTSYTFSGLTSGTYNIKVRAINGTFDNNGQNDLNTATTTATSVKTTDLATMSAVSSPSGYAQSKTGIVTFTGDGAYLIRPSVDVTTNIAAITCSNVSDAAFTCNGTTVAVNGTLKAGTWYKVAYSPTLTFISNGSLTYKVADGTNYIDGGALTISNIDRTAPSTPIFTTSKSTNSITVTIGTVSVDDQSGIKGYQFSNDGGATWKPSTPQTGTSYTFSGLTSGTYNIKVRTINGTFDNNGQNDLNTATTTATSVKTTDLATMSAVSSPSGYAQSKTGTVTFTGDGAYLIRPSVDVTTNIAAITCSNVSDAAFTCNGTTVAVNGTLKAGTWYKVASSPALTFISNGSLTYKVADGINYIDGGALTITGIDRTAPTSVSFTSTSTTNSIKVIAGGSDTESGLTGYQFSNDGGATWKPSTPQTGTTYTFSNLTSGTYSIKIRAINGTYENNKQNSLNTTESIASSVSTIGLGDMKFESSPSGYAQSKTGTITFTGSGTYLIRPSVSVTTNVTATTCSNVSDAAFTCNGIAVPINGTLSAGTWYKVTSSPTLTFTSNGTVTYKITDGTNYKDGGAGTINSIDRTAPISTTITTSKSSNSITVTATGTDNESGISGYQFSNDGGKTWVPGTPQSGKSYTFSGLTSGTYSIKARSINGTYENSNQNTLNTTESTATSVTTDDLVIVTPSVSPSGYAQSKTAQIPFTGPGTYLIKSSVAVTTNIAATTCSSVNDAAFTCNGGVVSTNGTLVANTWYKVTSIPTLTFTSNGSLTYKISDGTNHIDGAALTITGIDRTAPSAPTFTTTKTSNSITVKIGTAASDTQSGITGYQFSNDGGTTWKPSTPQTGTSYTFSSLTSGTYSIKVRAINGTYGNNGQNSLNTVTTSASSVATSNLATMSATSSPSGYAQSKTGKVTFTGEGTYLIKPSVAATTNIAATTCSSVSNAAFTCNGTVVAANGTLVAGTWYKVASNPTLTFTSNGSLTYKVTDGTNYIDGGALTISSIDRTAPSAPTFTTTKTTNSITVTIGTAASDAQSGITGYQFSSDGGTTWKPSTPQTGTSYTFSSLTSGTYNIKVRAINGTYGNNGQNDLNTVTTSASSVTTTGLGTMKFESSPSGYAQSKTGKVTFAGNGTYLIKSSVDTTINIAATTCSSVSDAAFTCNGTAIAANGALAANTWYKVASSPTLTFTSNGSLTYKISDGTNYIDGGAGTISSIDRTAPSAPTFTTSKSTNSITVNIGTAATDAQSGITGYQFSSDGGTTWKPSTPQTGTSYTFSSLTSGTYSIKVRAINGTYGNNGQNDLNTVTTSASSVTTSNLATMSATSSPSGYAQSKTGKITFTGNGTYLIKPSVATTINIAATTCSSVSNAAFTCNGTAIAANGTLAANTWYKVASSPTLTFTSNGTLTYKVTDGTNYIDGGALTISSIDRTAPSAPTFTTSKTASSITVTIGTAASDTQSGLAGYQFSSDGGTTWKPSTPQTGTSYTFSGLTSGTYSIKVRAINGTYGNNGQNTLNTVTTSASSVTTTNLATMSAVASPSGWSTSKTGKVTFTGDGTYLIKPSVSVKTNVAATTCSSVVDAAFTCNGTAIAANGKLAANTWYKVTSSPTLTFTSNGTLTYKVSDGTNYKDGGVLNVSQIDTTSPTNVTLSASSVATTTYATTQLQLTASAEDAQSDISRYEFYSGSTYLDSNATGIYIVTSFSNANTTYKVRVYNNAGGYTDKTLSETCTSSSPYGCSGGYTKTIYTCSGTGRKYYVQTTCSTTTTTRSSGSSGSSGTSNCSCTNVYSSCMSAQCPNGSCYGSSADASATCTSSYNSCVNSSPTGC